MHWTLWNPCLLYVFYTLLEVCAFYSFHFLSSVTQLIYGYPHLSNLSSCRPVCQSSGGEIFIWFSSFISALALQDLLQFLPCGLHWANCKCACNGGLFSISKCGHIVLNAYKMLLHFLPLHHKFPWLCDFPQLYQREALQFSYFLNSLLQCIQHRHLQEYWRCV